MRPITDADTIGGVPAALALALLIVLVWHHAASTQGNEAASDKPEIVSLKKIWDEGPHNAFTDLIRFQDKWFCSFRESEDHVGGDGRLRILGSEDGDPWQSAALLAEEGIDLRDPKLCITPDKRLMVVAGGSVYNGGKQLLGRQPRVAFSTDGFEWTPTKRVCEEGDWLWRVTWHEGKAYGVSRKPIENDENELTLYCAADGVHYEPVTVMEVPGRPNETTLRFVEGGRMIAFVRREGGSHAAWIGHSDPPYTEWKWHETKHRVGGPNFIQLPDGSFWAGARRYPGGAKTVLARFGLSMYEPVLVLPSGGDTSYPGLVWHEGLLWMSYYSSHEGKTSIYLAKIRLPE